MRLFVQVITGHSLMMIHHLITELMTHDNSDKVGMG